MIIKGLNINTETTGTKEGKDIILLHGWGSNLNLFRALAKELESNFNVYNLDFPGFGESDAPESVWGVEDYTTFIESFVAQNNISNPIIIGHSFGGRVALVYASRNPTNKLILIDAAGVKPKRPLKYYLKVYSFKLYKKILPCLLGSKEATKRIEQYRAKAGSSDYSSAQGIMRSILVKVVNEDLKYLMPKIESPTLLIWGENDTATPVRDAKIMEKLIKNSGLVVLKNAGHFSFLDKAYDVNIIIDNFLNGDKIDG